MQCSVDSWSGTAKALYEIRLLKSADQTNRYKDSTFVLWLNELFYNSYVSVHFLPGLAVKLVWASKSDPKS